MIDDRQTCDVCGEEFNESRPHHAHLSVGQKERKLSVKKNPTRQKPRGRLSSK